MGNCLVMEKKVIKIVRNDEKVLEYREPMSDHHIFSQFSNHSLTDNNTCDATSMIKKKIKKVTFANPEERLVREDDDDDDDDGEKNVSVVRMKIVVHKQELEKLLEGGSVHEMVYQSLEKQCFDDNDNDHLECNRSWRPMLDCIPETE